MLASWPNKSVNHVTDVSLVFCLAPEVGILSSKSRSGINNLCLVTRRDTDSIDL